MARKVIEVILDDVTGQEIAGESNMIRITVDVLDSDLKVIKGKTISQDYEVGNFTLSQLAGFVGGEQDFGQMLNSFRKVVKIPATGGTSDSSDALIIREWAKANGIEVNERGRIPADVEAKYRAAHEVNAASPVATTSQNADAVKK